MNEVAIKLYGWAATDLIDKPFKTILPPEVREHYDTLLEGVLGGMPVTDVETTHWTKKGELIPTLMGIRTFKDQTDEVVGTIAYMKPVPSLKRAEDALKQIQDVLLSSNDPVAIIDLNGKIIDFNPAAERAYSRQKESTVGKEGSILVSEAARQVYIDAFNGCLEGNIGKNIEIECITRQEVVRHTLLSFNLLMDARNQPFAMSVIEKRKSAKEKAERAYSHLLEAFLEIPDPVIIENMAGEVVEMNRTAANFFGWKKVDVLGKTGKLLIPPDQHARHLELIQLCKNGEFIRDEKSTRWSKTGSYYAVSLTMFLLLNTMEEPDAIITIAKPLDGVGILPGRGLNLNMDTLFQEAVDPIIIEDMTGNVISLNKAAEALLGWKTSEIMGKPMRNIIPADKHKLHEKILLLIQNGVPIKRVESKLWAKRGEVYPVAVSVLPQVRHPPRVSLVLLKDENNEPIAVASINQDLSVMKKLVAGTPAAPPA